MTIGKLAEVTHPKYTVTGIRGSKSGREIKIGDDVTEDDGDFVMEMRAPGYVDEFAITIGVSDAIPPAVKVSL